MATLAKTVAVAGDARTKAVLPANIRIIMHSIIGYARWNGTKDSSTRDMPVFV